jgi:hypothetical protein
MSYNSFYPNYARSFKTLVAAGLPASGSAEGDQGFSLRLNSLKSVVVVV